MEQRQHPAVTLRQLYHFVLAAEAGKISEAAQRVRMAPSALSMSISELERLLDAQLCVKKKSKGITLTPVGEMILAQARDVLQIVGEMPYSAREHQSELRGPLAVGCLNPLAPALLAPVLGDYNAMYPSVEVAFYEEFHEPLQALVMEGTLDLALTFGLSLDPGLEVIKVDTAIPRALFAADHPLAKKKSVTLSDLAEGDFLLSGPDPISGRVVDMFQAAGVGLQVKNRTRGFATARALVGRGRFVTVVYENYPVPVSAEGRPLALRTIDDSAAFNVDIVVIRSRGVRLNARSRAWIDLAKEIIPHSYDSMARVYYGQAPS